MLQKKQEIIHLKYCIIYKRFRSSVSIVLLENSSLRRCEVRDFKKKGGKYMEVLFLEVLSKMNGVRTVSGPLHLLKGKRSSQTIQDIGLFQCDKWAAALKHVPYSRLRKVEEQLYVHNMVHTENKSAFLTEKGYNYLNKHREIMHNLQFNGRKWEWDNEAEIFWQRLSLLTQAVSHKQYKNSSYLPVYAPYEVKYYVKNILRQNNSNNLAEELFHFLNIHLKEAGEERAELFMARLSGYNYTGRTFFQLENQNAPVVLTYLEFRSIIHQMLEDLESSPAELYGLFPVKEAASQVTASAAITGKAVKEGRSLQETARFRKLKESTIEDHLVELAMHDPSFEYERFISSTILANIFEAVEKHSGERKLKDIRESLGKKVSYFHIRLALALLHKNKQGERDSG
ncbi:hypothetical protein C6Y45_00355 [Alkalicoccus saliphilus]|uniref:Helicase Helix-turn-helix domain-containing protein n=2 Tax=Alkalicoccus saliphilus TaxID=200989 RepID=A0A2T4UAH3_9BACI|nr:hypothetical protein C6Y45_00355 [Alkalicoccus saliphilus]